MQEVNDEQYDELMSGELDNVAADNERQRR